MSNLHWCPLNFMCCGELPPNLLFLANCALTSKILAIRYKLITSVSFLTENESRDSHMNFIRILTSFTSLFSSSILLHSKGKEKKIPNDHTSGNNGRRSRSLAHKNCSSQMKKLKIKPRRDIQNLGKKSQTQPRLSMY